MSFFKTNNVDSERLDYLISIRWYILIAAVLGFLVVLRIFGPNQKILLAGALGGLGFSLAMLGSALGRSQMMLMAAVLFLLAVYFLPNFGKEFRGQVISFFFFTGLVVFSLAIFVMNFFHKKLNK